MRLERFYLKGSIGLENTLKKKLANNENAFGTFIMTNGLDTAEILAHAGADCIMIDGEHGSMDLETAGRMVSIIRGTSTVPLLRVAGNEPSLIKRGLDTGAAGIMIPMVNTREEAEKAVRLCKYPPVGVRGMGAGRAILFGSGAEEFENYFKNANDEGLIIVQIEHIQAVENIEEILSVPGIDIAFVGPLDLSTSMGLSGQLNHPEVQKQYIKVVEACQKHKVIPGIMSWSGGMEHHLDIGFKFLLGGIDAAILYQGVRRLVKEFKNVTK
jgi:2-keto-3-deoxy-L-rhamnonate aldolase RhmA